MPSWPSRAWPLLATYSCLPTTHLPTTYQPSTDHLPTTYQPLTIHLPTTYCPPTVHLPTPYHPPTNHLLSTYRPLTDHLPTTYHPPTDHLLTIYRPLFYGAACSWLPWELLEIWQTSLTLYIHVHVPLSFQAIQNMTVHVWRKGNWFSSGVISFAYPVVWWLWQVVVSPSMLQMWFCRMDPLQLVQQAKKKEKLQINTTMQ